MKYEIHRESKKELRSGLFPNKDTVFRDAALQNNVIHVCIHQLVKKLLSVFLTLHRAEVLYHKIRRILFNGRKFRMTCPAEKNIINKEGWECVMMIGRCPGNTGPLTKSAR
jgi:hypothetical protein